MPKPSKATKKQEARTEAPVLYPEIVVTKAVGEDAITVEQMKDLLGWEEVPTWDEACCPEIRSACGKNVRLVNNTKNRPITYSWLLTVRQAFLTKNTKGHSKWMFNGVSFVVGKHGSVLEGQHRGIAFILAEIERTEGKNARNLQELFPEPLRMETIVVYGVEEDDETFQTLNQGKPASTADVLYRHELFGSFKPNDRKVICRMTDYAVRMIWKRTGAGLNSFAPYRTPAESVEFLMKHLKLLEGVKHIWEENKEGNRISKLLSPGYASALLYLMGSSSSDVDEYRTLQPSPSERVLKWDLWDKACEFWVLLASSDTFHEVRQALYGLRDPDTGEDGHITEKVAILAKAWAAFSEGVTPRPEDLTLEYDTDEDGIRHLKEHPLFGGIDLGDTKEEETDEDGAAPPPAVAVRVSEDTPPPAPAEPAKKARKQKEEVNKEPQEPTEDEAKAKREEHKAKILEARKKNPPKPKKKQEATEAVA